MKHGSLIGLLAGLLASPALGCGSDPAGGGAGPTANEGGGGAGGAGGAGGGADSCNPIAAPQATDVSGRWASREIGSQIAQAPGLDPFSSRIVSVRLIEQQQSGDQLTVSAQYCAQYTEDPDALVHAVIPDTYRDALKPVTRTGTFASADGALRYRLPRLAEVVGATLSDPAKDALPTEPADPLVIDQDGDSHPGMTLHLKGLVDGDVYLVERKWTEFDGVAVSADRIEGHLGFSSEQSVLASDPEILKTSTDATKTFPDPEPCNSTFEMVRIPADVDCAAIRAQEDTLFK